MINQFGFGKWLPKASKPAGAVIEYDLPGAAKKDATKVLPQDPSAIPGWTRYGSHVWAPDVAEAWRAQLAHTARSRPNTLAARNGLITSLLDGLSKFFLAMNLNPLSSAVYVRPFTAMFGLAPGAEQVAGTNGGIGILAAASDSGLRGPNIIYPVPAGLRADGSTFRNTFTRSPMKNSVACGSDDGTCAYTVAGTTAIPSPQTTIDFLKAVVDGLDDQSLAQLVSDSHLNPIQADPSYPPPSPPIEISFGREGGGGGGGGGGSGVPQCTPPVVTSRAEADLWNAEHPSCPTVFVPFGRGCSYSGPPMTQQSEVEAWNSAHPDCKLPDIEECRPTAPLTTEFELAAWRANHSWCDPSLYRTLSAHGNGGEEESSDNTGLFLLLGAGALALYFATRKG